MLCTTEYNGLQAFSLSDANAKILLALEAPLPVKTVRVMGDARTYEDVLALRAGTSTDAMTADSFEFAWDRLGRCATRIKNEVRGVNRVVYHVASKLLGTVEWG